MRILRWNDLQAVPWKNGQGITRELAKELNGDGFFWRLSIADVASDGPFSRFEGMRRILTVVEGNGMELISPDMTLQADLGVPVEFDGELEITSSLKGGPLRDLNLIFDPRVYGGHVSRLVGGKRHSLRCDDGKVFAVYCLMGTIALPNSETLHKGDTALLDEAICEVRIDEGSIALLVQIERLH